MSGVNWSYRLAVGRKGGTVLDWTATTTDPPPTDWTTGGQPGLLLDGLQLSHKLPEDEPWPCQPHPKVLTFQVAATTAVELATQLVMGSPVAYRQAQESPIGWRTATWFTGYVSTVTMEARWDEQLGTYTVATVTCMEWPAAFAEVVVGDEVWPLEGAPNRLTRIMELVWADSPTLVQGGWDYETPEDATPMGEHIGLATRDVDAQPALDLILEVLGCWTKLVLDSHNGFTYARYQLLPYHATGYLDLWAGLPGYPPGDFHNVLALDAWRLRAVPAAPTTSPPAVFGDTGAGLWGVVMDPEFNYVPASAVELPARWSQRIGGVPNKAVLVVPFAGYTAGQGQYTWRYKLPEAQRPHPVRIKRAVPIEFSTADDSTYLDGVTATYHLSTILIPDTINPDTSWGVDDLEWHAAAEDEFRWWPFELGQLITVTDVPPAAHPTGSRWIHGQLAEYTITITEGRPVVKFSTRPQLRDSMADDVMAVGDIPAGVTLAELDPTLTLHDLRMLRTP